MTTSNASACEQEGVAPNTTARTQPAAPSDHSDEKTRAIQFDNGDVYEGELKDGKPHGKGVTRYVNGDVYDGEWKDGIRHGTGTFDNGCVYIGEWKDGLMHGTGTYTYENGAVYEGEFENDNLQGKGTYKDEKGGIYVGDWTDDTKNGRGVYRYADACVYEGEFKDDKRHGRGIMKYSRGGVYDGQWEEGTKHGEGIYRYESGNIYEGCWVGGEPHGRGTMKFSSGNVYEGQWLEGLQHGEGTLKWKSGNAFTGEFVGGKRHGWGTLTSASGDVYEGQWVEGKRHGKAFKTKGMRKTESKEGASPSAPSAGAQTNDAAPATSSELTNGRNRELPSKVYERQLRSQKSQQRRHHIAKKTCENCGADDYHYKLRVCSGCDLALYCSAACQKAASGSHRRICNIVSQLPSKDVDRLNLDYDREKMVDLDAGLRYATKYMDNLKHLEIDVRGADEDDTVKLSVKQLSSLLRSKKEALDSVFWMSNLRCKHVSAISKNGNGVWKELYGLKQLTLRCAEFDDVQPLHDIICQQRNTLMVLCLPHLQMDWSRAKCRRTLAQAVKACKLLVRLDLSGCMLTDSDLKVMLQDLPDLRVLDLLRRTSNSHEFTDNTCGLIARKCPGLQELNLNDHNHLSARGLRKIFEGCIHLRSFHTTTRKLSCSDVQNLLDVAPQLLFLSLDDDIDLSEEEITQIIEATGGRTVLGMTSNEGLFDSHILSAKARENYERNKCLLGEILGDLDAANEWAGMLEG